jgi:hypothetical protein
MLHGDAFAGWKRYAPKAIARRVAGGHMTCLTDHVEALARRVCQYLGD